jgi:hypothetical protein
MTRRIYAALLVLLLPGVILGFQLASRTLEERVRDASLIVVGSVAATHSRTTSLIMGVGDVWRVSLRVSAVLKGKVPEGMQVTFVDVAVQDFPSFRPDQERVWLLTATSEPGLFSAPASYESVLVAAEAAHIRTLLSICGPHPRSWDKEHALIEEADLTPEEVKKAEAWIERAKHPPPNPPGEMEMLAGAGENIIEGYKLKREYERHPSPATKQKFCKWMATAAYWPE